MAMSQCAGWRCFDLGRRGRRFRLLVLLHLATAFLLLLLLLLLLPNVLPPRGPSRTHATRATG